MVDGGGGGGGGSCGGGGVQPVLRLEKVGVMTVLMMIPPNVRVGIIKCRC